MTGHTQQASDSHSEQHREDRLDGIPFGPAHRMWLKTAPGHEAHVSAALSNQASGLRVSASGAGACYLIIERRAPNTACKPNYDLVPIDPYIERIWREDYLWPGALAHEDFISRCAEGICKRWMAAQSENTPSPKAISVQATFRDRSHLCSRLRQALHLRFTGGSRGDGVTTPTKSTRPPSGHLLPNSVSVLLTPKAVVASFLPLDGRAMNVDVPEAWRASLRGTSFPSRAAQKCLAALATGYGGGLWLAAADREHGSDDPTTKPLPLAGQTWIDAGASPGGMTAALMALGARVIALDRAPLQAELMDGKPKGLLFHQCDARTVNASDLRTRARVTTAHGLVCDINGSVTAACEAVKNLSAMLAPMIPVIFTLKLTKLAHPQDAVTEARQKLASVGIDLLGARHFEANRHELTLLGQTQPRSPRPS